MGVLCNPLEADTRKLIDTSLENLGWIFKGKDKNVFLEQPRTEEERQALEHKRPDYVLYSKDHEPLIVIEAKKKGERIDTALEQGIFYAQRLKAPLVYATDGVFCKAFHVEANRPPLLNGNELDEFIRQALALRFMGNYEVNTISPKVQYDRKELIKVFDNANNMLRGDGLRAGIERFGEFANILFIKLLSEKGNIDDSCSWETIRQMPISTRISYINSTVYNKLNNIYNTEIFTPLTMQDNEILDEIMKSLDPLTLTDVDSDVKGDAFEYFLKASTASGNDLGEYFTPRHIVKTMVRLVNPQIGEKVYDPFCGTGGFLIESFRHIYNNMPRNEATEKMLRENTIFGNEITNTARITKMNMILAGDGHSGIQKTDSLANPIEGKYDVVLANMPYSQKTKWGTLYDVPSKNGDSICIQHCMKAISATSENGRMALVVPEGFLFRKDLKKTREYLLENSELQSIISLPQGVFLPYTGVKTDIIYATKVNQKIPSSKKRKNYWYFEVKNDGYSLDNYRRKLETPSDLQKYEEYRKLDEEQKEEMQKIGFDIIPFDKVKEKDFNFVGSRYRKTEIFSTNFPLLSLEELQEYNILTITKGKTITKKTAISGIYPVIAGGQSSPYSHNQFTHDGETITISASGAYSGYVWYHNQPIWASDCSVIQIDTTQKLMTKYLYYILKNQQKKIYSLQHGSGQPHVYPDDIKNLFIPLPPLEIQEKIVRELEDYQNIIDGAKQVIENYKPTLVNISAYPLYELGNLVKIKGGKRIPKGKTFSLYRTNHPYIRITDFKDYSVNELNLKYISDEVFSTISNYCISSEDVYISIAGTIGLVGTVPKHLNGANLTENAAKLIINNTKQLNKYFLTLVLNSPYCQEQIKELTHGQTVPKLALERLKTLLIPLPDLDEQKRLVNIIGTEQELIRPAYQLIELFTKKIQDRINQLFEEKQ